MKEYDVVVIGSGSGMMIVEEALAHDMKVALVDKGPYGGTCLNSGCIPSKMLIFPADRIVEIRESQKLGIDGQVGRVDFPVIMQRMRKSTRETQRRMRENVTHVHGLDFYEGEGRFTGDHTLEVKNKTIKGKQVFIASGSRTFIPPIPGLEDVDYLTNETLLELDQLPKSLIIIGGGYIGVEYGHFFAAMGTDVTIVEMLDHLVPFEEPEIVDLLEKKLRERMTVYTGAQAQEVRRKGGDITVRITTEGSGEAKEISAEQLLVAVGRRSNADTLNVAAAGIELTEKGYIKTDDLLQTSRKDIWAVGDANGRLMFTHVANREAMIAADNAIHGEKGRMNYNVMPHAVYTHPQIASVGMTEAMAKKEHDILIGRAKYLDVTKGEAMMEDEGFAKAIIDRDGGKILGFHIIGPQAPVLIQEVVNAMASSGHLSELNQGVHIHPALSELVQVTVNNLEEP